MIKINARGAHTLAESTPLIFQGQNVYVTVDADVATLHLAGRAVAEVPAEQIKSTKDAQDFAYRIIEMHEIEVETVATPDLDAVADAVYGSDAEQIRYNGEAMLAEAVALAARAALPFKIRNRSVSKSDPRHPAQASKTLARKAEALIAWTARDEMSYVDYVQSGLADTDGHFAPLDRSAWKLTLGA